jgi:hypothetical protein
VPKSYLRHSPTRLGRVESSSPSTHGSREKTPSLCKAEKLHLKPRNQLGRCLAFRRTEAITTLRASQRAMLLLLTIGCRNRIATPEVS